jgi:phosphatidylinositol-3-phosphatase
MTTVRQRLSRMNAASRYGILAAVVALAAGILVPVAAAASTAAPTAAGQPGSPGWRGGPRLDHVFVIMLENHEADHVIGDPNTPFITSLARQYGVATKYYGVTHTSEPNYIAATSGSTWWNNDDDGWYTGNHYPNPKIAGNHFPHTNIVTEMEARHIPWAAYMQAMPRPGYLPDSWPQKPPSGSAPLYASKHNPFVLYNDIRFNPAWRDHIRPYRDMAAELNGPNPPRYVWISPDQCNDMHGGVYAKIKGFPETPCPYSNVAGDKYDEALKAKADAFVKEAVHTIMSSRAWTGNSVIFITADESDYDGSKPTDDYYLSVAGCCDSPYLPAGDPEISPKWPGGLYGGGSAPMIVVSRTGPRHATDPTPSNHYSMLLTTEQGLGLPELGYTSDSAQVHPLWPLITRR